MTTRAIHAVLSTLVAALLAPGARADLDRPPSILEVRQVGDGIRLLWAPGGNADGTLNGEVVSYTLQRQGLGPTTWTTVFPGDKYAMTYVDSVDDSATWASHQGGSVEYRVESNTASSDTTLSTPVSLVPSLPVWIEEAQDGKARLAWVASTSPHPSYPVHLGYRVQKLVSGSWTDLTGYLSVRSYLDPATTTGVSRYRVRSVYKKSGNNATQTLDSNEVEIQLGAVCDGQATNPAIPPLSVIVIDDRDSDLDYDGDDIADALEECADKVYEDLSGAGDDDGVCETGNGETCITGGCILRALPETYDNVAIMLTGWGGYCDDDPEADPATWNDISHPEHCLVLDFPAGLVIEGQGHETVFRSPVWDPPYMFAPVLELQRREFPVTLRNLVLDGRKHEQVYPEHLTGAEWHHFGFRVWNQFEQVETLGDGIGDDDGACEVETCVETGAGNDGDGHCEAGETCLDQGGGACDNDAWTNAMGCYSPTSTDDGCIHNVEVRNVLVSAVRIENAQRWIIEDSEFHDTGCVNRGYGVDCLNLEEAPDDPSMPGEKTAGYGLDIGWFTSQFQIRRNEIYRTTKYALSFKNASAASCVGRLEDHEASYNVLHDLGRVGIFNHGTAGARIHHNTIDSTTLWNEPDSLNGHFNTFGMSLGGFCSDDNQFSDNTITNMAGLAIHWDGAPETVECTPGGCTPVSEVGNVISDTTIDGICLEKNAAPGTPVVYGYGSIQTGSNAAGTLSLIDNTLANSECSFTIAAYGQHTFTQPLAIEVAGGSYESGENAPTLSENTFYCGAMHAHGSNRKIVVGDDTSIVNTTEDTIPKACIGYDATIVIDDDPDDPFADGPYTDVSKADGTGTVVYCSASPTHPDCQ